jgi:hypothetical protein
MTAPRAPLGDTPLQRVQIVNPGHPHFEEYGRFTGKIIKASDVRQVAER